MDSIKCECESTLSIQEYLLLRLMPPLRSQVLQQWLVKKEKSLYKARTVGFRAEVALHFLVVTHKFCDNLPVILIFLTIMTQTLVNSI